MEKNMNCSNCIIQTLKLPISVECTLCALNYAEKN